MRVHSFCVIAMQFSSFCTEFKCEYYCMMTMVVRIRYLEYLGDYCSLLNYKTKIDNFKFIIFSCKRVALNNIIRFYHLHSARDKLSSCTGNLYILIF